MEILRSSILGFRFIPVFFLFFSQVALSHKQPVHQYIAREAYSLLLQTKGGDIPQLSAFIGLADQSYAGDSAWQKGYITTGAWREDDEDVAYHYDILPGLNYALTSITHFWDADQGDFTKNMFRLVIERPPLPPISTDIGPFPNAFDKMIHYAHGGWVIWYPRAILCKNVANDHYLVITPLVTVGGFGIPVSYNDLTAFYTNKTLAIRADQPAECLVFDVNDLKTIDLADVAGIKVDEDARNTIVWEVLGRMCHLLGDMSIPAHAHRDEHGLNPDSYEDYVGGAGDPYKAWDHTNAGQPIILNAPTDEVLHFLMYVLQQQSDHFGSNGPAQGNGNDNVGGNPTQLELSFLTAINLTSLGGPTSDAGPWTVANLNIIRDRTLPFAIRATAGLLYWFCRQTGITDVIATSAPGEGRPLLPETPSLAQNYPNPFNPVTSIEYSIPVGTYSSTSLRVYDILGREVAVLVNERKAPGTYSVSFDAKGLASGVYFYRLTAGDFTQTRKLVLQK